jgi:hypothetical protein
MKTLGTLSMAVLLLLTAGSIGIYAQDADRPPQGQEEKAKPNDKDKDKNKGAMQEERRDKDQPNMKQDERRDRQQDQKEQRMDQRQDQKMDQRMERNEHQHAAGAKQGKKIPDDKFRSHFGQQHKTKVKEVIHTTTIVPGQTQFVYGGYNFVFVDPWPAEWAFTDDCYIDFIDGEYVLVNPFHPGFYVALNVVGGF